jgi:4-hydroxybenzoate polyprenyltransferase
MARIKDYFSLIVFSHTIFAMPFALIGFFLANQFSGYPFSIQTLMLCVLCMVLARNAAMSFNRYADRFIDQKNPRTTQREIPRGAIKGRSVLLFAIVNSILFILAASLLNTLSLILSPVALFIILIYSYTKRFTWLCHLILGLGLSLAPIGAYIAMTGHFHWLPLLFSGIVLTWVSGFDIIYALQDEQFDKANKLFSIPSKVGIHKALFISALLHLITICILILTGILASMGLTFWIGSAIFTALLFYQHLIVSPNNLSRVTRAFGTTNGIASIIFAALVISDLFLS